MDENWKPVPGYEDLYEASDLGRLKRIATPTGKPRCKIIRPHLKASGYADYWVWSDGKKKRFSAHRLIWMTFNGDIPRGLEINHLNGIKTDNRLANFELATKSWNAAHSFRILGRPAPRFGSPGTKNAAAILNDDAVREIRRLYEAKQFDQYQLGDKFGVSQRTISLVVRRKTWVHVA